jgi:YVTN family beta-propeller protein
MKLLTALFGMIMVLFTNAQLPKQVQLPNGWSLSPAGRSFELGDLPLNIAVSKSKKYMAVTNNGQSVQSIQLIDARSEKVLHSELIPKSWYGLKFSGDEKFLYASGGNDNWILQYAVKNNKLVLHDSIKLGDKWPNRISPAGIEIDDEKQLMYVVTKDNNSLYVINLKTKQVQQQVSLGSEAYTALLSPDKKTLYISLWGKAKVLVWDLATQRKKEWAVGDHPNEMCMTKNGKFLFVANANDNSVSVINTAEGKVVETLNAALYPNSPSGSTSNGVALSTDEKTLYVANADNNCLAVFDVENPVHLNQKGSSLQAGIPPILK